MLTIFYKSLFSVILLILLAVAPSCSPKKDTSSALPWQEFEQACSKLRAPPGLTLRISSDKTLYFAGEPVLITTTYEMKGKEKVNIDPRDYNRAGRISELEWTVVGPDGKRAADPLSEHWLGRISGGLSGGPDVVRAKEPVSQKFYINEWVRFDLPGEYEIALISRRLYGPWAIASNRIRIRIVKAPPNEISRAAERYAEILDRKKPQRKSPQYPEYCKALKALRFLHHERAVPYYLKYLNDKDLTAQIICGLYGIPDRKKTFNTLLSWISSDKNRPIFKGTYWLLLNLYHSIHYPPEKKENIGMKYSLPEEKRLPLKKQLWEIASKKTPEARAISILSLTAWGKKDYGYSLELAKSLDDLPESELENALFRLYQKKCPGIEAYLEKYVKHPDNRVRSYAIQGLINQGCEKYIKIYTDDYLSEKPSYYLNSDYPKKLTEEQQIKLASHLDNKDWNVAESAAQRLKKFASSKKLLPYVEKALRRWPYPRYKIKADILETWAKVDPAGAKNTIIEFIKSDPPSNRPYDNAGLLKYYLDDPKVIKLLEDIIRSKCRTYWAIATLASAKHPAAVPLLLEQAESMSNPADDPSWQYNLSSVTGHIVSLTDEHNTAAKQKAVIEEWKHWWNIYKNKPAAERLRSNIEHSISLLDSEELSFRAQRYLFQTTGKKFDQELWTGEDGKLNYAKLKQLWTDWWMKNNDKFE